MGLIKYLKEILSISRDYIMGAYIKSCMMKKPKKKSIEEKTNPDFDNPENPTITLYD